jgi:hypothetical protein
MSRCILANLQLVTARRGADMDPLSISEHFATTVIICVRTDMQISKNIVVSHLVKKRFAFYVSRRFIQQMSLP